MGDEELGVGRVHDHHAHLFVRGDLRNEAAELENQIGIQQVDRWIVDGRAADPVSNGDSNVLVVVIGHEQTLCDSVLSGTVLQGRVQGLDRHLKIVEQLKISLSRPS